MTQKNQKTQFKATLLRPAKAKDSASWAFVILPNEVSEKLPRRGRTTVAGTINGHPFQQTLEPDGQLSHWLQISQELYHAAGVNVGERVTLEIAPVKEPEPELPPDLVEALAAAPQAAKVWHATTTLARLDWIHWITTAKQSKTRSKRIHDACDMLAAGKKRVCCFDPSGYYSKAFRPPEAAE